MPRKARFFLPEVPNHIVQRGRNRDPVFFESSDYYFYLEKLREALLKYNAELHAYVLMTNHVHLLISAKEPDAISHVMQYVGRYYVPYINHKYGFSGSLWEGRFKSSLIESESYLFSCMRYIELNPVRAMMCETPEQYLYSSYHANALGKEDLLVTLHKDFINISDRAEHRCQFYKSLFSQVISAEDMMSLKSSYESGTPIGSSNFKKHIETVLNRKVGHVVRGRPLKIKG